MSRHFVLVLPPFAPMGPIAQYFWVLQKWLHDFAGQHSTVILPRRYADRFEEISGWEFDEEIGRQNQYVPSHAMPENVDRIFYDEEMIALGRKDAANARFSHYVTHALDPFVAFYDAVLSGLKAKGIQQPVCLSWVNNPSLRIAADRHDCPTIFAELGPLRAPTYQASAYWDPAGVNGATRAASLWREEKAAFSTWLGEQCTADVRSWVRSKMVVPAMQQAVTSDDEHFDAGLALQIETDSNLLAYGNGWTNLGLVEHVDQLPDVASKVIKYHPHGKAIYEGPVWPNGSATSFLSSVSKLYTINSSMGMEAALWGKDVEIFGDSPFLPYFEEEGAAQDSFLAWFFLRYLCPYEVVFDGAYHDWRLSNPSCGEIAERHLAHYARPEAGRWRDARVAQHVAPSDEYIYFGPMHDLIPR